MNTHVKTDATVNVHKINSIHLNLNENVVAMST